ncbi:hypothetical protein GW16_14925 [Xanthomonas arboricola pv. celebensis]|uniref:hypothetical protein n=1 Tax=Xanthomonas arboricola TaxID=56448 RepID=UPI0004D5C485|nr:hypothetical protein [Xanthomonas arboricola]KER83342.1 hypothetical protein GW16_14925 [Xanthomonas arboricola pv. celebensis]
MGIPSNYALKGHVDVSKSASIQTLEQTGFSSDAKVLATYTLRPDEVRTLIQRLYWTSLQGDLEYHVNGEHSRIVATYPFQSFWDVVTDLFAIAQYCDDYSVTFGCTLLNELKLEQLQFPHQIRIELPMHDLATPLAASKIVPHEPRASAFECRAEIISNATYVEGMLHKIILDSGFKTATQLKRFKYKSKIEFCDCRKLVDADLLSIVDELRELRNEAAHEFSFGDLTPGSSSLAINPVSDELMHLIERFVSSCERRYKIKPARIERFRNSMHMLAGELNEKACLSQVLVLGKQFPDSLATYFYG